MADLYQHHRMILRDTDTGPVTIGGMIHREPTDGTLRVARMAEEDPDPRVRKASAELLSEID